MYDWFILEGPVPIPGYDLWLPLFGFLWLQRGCFQQDFAVTSRSGGVSRVIIMGFGSPDALNKLLIYWRDFPWKRGEDLWPKCAWQEGWDPAGKMCRHSWQAVHPSTTCCFTYRVCMSLEAAWPSSWQGPQSRAGREIHTEGETMSHYAAC